MYIDSIIQEIYKNVNNRPCKYIIKYNYPGRKYNSCHTQTDEKESKPRTKEIRCVYIHRLCKYQHYNKHY